MKRLNFVILVSSLSAGCIVEEERFGLSGLPTESMPAAVGVPFTVTGFVSSRPGGCTDSTFEGKFDPCKEQGLNLGLEELACEDDACDVEVEPGLEGMMVVTPRREGELRLHGRARHEGEFFEGTFPFRAVPEGKISLTVWEFRDDRFHAASPGVALRVGAVIASTDGLSVTYEPRLVRCATDGSVLESGALEPPLCNVVVTANGRGFVEAKLKGLSSRIEIDVPSEAPSSLAIIDEEGNTLEAIEFHKDDAFSYFLAGVLADGRRVLFNGATVSATESCEAELSVTPPAYRLGASAAGLCELVAQYGELEARVPVTVH